MNPPPGSGPGFTVSMSAATAQQLRDLHTEATADGRGAEFVDAMRQVSDRLRSDPVKFGEDLFDLRGLRLTVKVGVVFPLVVEFGVYADQRIVFVRSFRYAPPG